MRKVICPNGHHYDAERFGNRCPQCGAAMQEAARNNTSEQTTVPLEPNFNFQPASAGSANSVGSAVTVPNSKPVEPIAPPASIIAPTVPESGDATMPVASDMLDGIITNAAPTVGWLVCTKGINKGKNYTLHQGRNFIGRAPTMDVYIQGDTTVSRSTHAVVVYDPRGNVYLAQPGDAKELLYINGALVLNPTELKRMDKLDIGETTLMFIPLCGEDFHW